MIPVDFGQVDIEFSQLSSQRPAMITIGIDPDVTFILTGTANVLLGNLRAANHLLNASQYTADLSFRRLRVTVVSSSGPVYDEKIDPNAGTRATPSGPPQVSALVRRQTNLGGRKGRGRLYLPSGYCTETEVLPGGVIDPARVTSLQTLFNNLAADLATIQVSPVLLHAGPSPAPTPITSWSVQGLVATQRRRLRK